MAVKTFTTGEVLTASDTNTYLNNGGLVYIKSQTIGTGVSSVSVTSAFSADYDNYRITLTDVAFSVADTSLFVKPGNDSTAGSYFGGGFYVKYDGTGNGWNVQNGTTAGIPIGITDSNATGWAFELFAPFLAKRTRGFGTAAGLTYVQQNMGYHNQATSYTSFTMIPGSGTLTGGTVRVYGYRQA